MTQTTTNFLPISMPAHLSMTAGIIQSAFPAEACRRLPVHVALRAEAHSRARSTPAEPGSSSRPSPPLHRTVTLLQPDDDYVSFSSPRVAPGHVRFICGPIGFYYCLHTRRPIS